jgi:hypothetical protein
LLTGRLCGPLGASVACRYSFFLIALFLAIPPCLRSAETTPAAERESTVATTRDTPVPSDLTVEGLVSYGNYRIFAAGRDCKLYTSGIEYDRHSWGYFLGARLDYVAEILPLVLLKEGVVTAPWGQPLTPARRIVPGISISPIGFRLLWRSRAAIKPYLTAKGGFMAFTKKVPATQASYENFNLQSAMGVQTRLTSRVDLRLGLFGDFHFSNAFIVPDNAGLDVMNANFGVTYHLNRDRH